MSKPFQSPRSHMARSWQRGPTSRTLNACFYASRDNCCLLEFDLCAHTPGRFRTAARKDAQVQASEGNMWQKDSEGSAGTSDTEVEAGLTVVIVHPHIGGEFAPDFHRQRLVVG